MGYTNTGCTIINSSDHCNFSGEEMKAKQARKAIKGVETKMILESIKYAITFGSTTTVYPGLIKDDTKTELEKLGYRVELYKPGWFSTGWDTECTYIYW